MGESVWDETVIDCEEILEKWENEITRGEE